MPVLPAPQKVTAASALPTLERTSERPVAAARPLSPSGAPVTALPLAPAPAPSNPRLPSGLDAALISDAFHEMDVPEDPTLVVTLLKNIGRSLKPQGRLGIVDWTPGAGGPGPPADQRVNPAAVIRAASAAGLQLILREDFPPFVFLLVFGRANARSSP